MQKEIYNQIIDYMKNEHINQTQLAKKLGVTKGYISQLLKGNLNLTLKNLIKLSLVLDKVPVIEFKPVNEILKEEVIKHADVAFNSFFEKSI